MKAIYLLNYTPHAVTVSRIRHSRGHLISRKFRPSSQFHLFFLLDYGATGTTERHTTVATAATFNTKTFTSFTSLDRLYNPLRTKKSKESKE